MANKFHSTRVEAVFQIVLAHSALFQWYRVTEQNSTSDRLGGSALEKSEVVRLVHAGQFDVNSGCPFSGVHPLILLLDEIMCVTCG